MPMMTMKVGDHVRWYVATLGDFNNAHSPHWHGNTVLVSGQRTDVLSIISAQMITADMIPTPLESGSTIATSATTCSPEWLARYEDPCCARRQMKLRFSP